MLRSKDARAEITGTLTREDNNMKLEGIWESKVNCGFRPEADLKRREEELSEVNAEQVVAPRPPRARAHTLTKASCSRYCRPPSTPARAN